MSAAKRTSKPRLRFPEFQDAGEWESRELHELATIINEKAGRNKFTLMSISAGVGLVSQIEKFGREIAGAQYKNYFVIRKNDFAYNKSATKEYPEGCVAMYSGEDPAAVPNSIFTCFRVDDSNVSPRYLNYLFFGNLHGKWLKKYITVGARAHGSLNIDNNDLLSMPVPLPPGESSLNEQQKIADCLSSIDEVITAEAQKLGALKTHKKGLMQQLFPAEGETLPRLRFPEFRDAAGWSKTKLKNVLTEHRLKSDGKSEVHSVSVHKGVVNQKEHLGRRFAAADTSNYNLAKPYDVIYTKSPTGDFPYGVIKHNHNSYNVIVSPLYGVFSPINKYLGYIFDAYFESPIRTNNYLAPITQKGAKNTIQISNETFLSDEIYLPHEEAEQQKIAGCLSSIDVLIAAEIQKLDTLKAHKKGLMQQLFPVPDEVQG